jgi:hypothetical protein
MKSLTLLLIIVSAVYLSSAAVNVQMVNGKYYTAVLQNGATAQKYDIVFIGDGFTSSEQTLFNTKVDEAVNALRALSPYSDRMCAFNIWRVNVVSAESGIDHPKDNVSKNTELDCRYGNPANGEAERCIRSDSPAKCIEAADYAPDHDAVFVLVNDTQWGGCAGAMVFSSISTGFASIITHELGHKIGGLADEYDCYICDGSDNNRTYASAEPAAANLTKDVNRATTKWADLIAAATPIPTTVNNPPGVVGLWEGGGYYQFGIYRPQISCQMRDLQAFCAVCNRTMRAALEAHCSYCDIHPLAFICWWLNWGGKLVLTWDYPYRWHWPFPPCLQCPPDRLVDDVIYVLEGVREGFTMVVYDDRGVAVAEGKPIRNAIEVRFKALRTRQYSVELISSEKPTRETLTLVSTVTRNGPRESPR